MPEVELGGEPSLWDIGLQLHKARRAGRHYDLRLVDPEGSGHSWVVRNGLPQPGKGTYAIRQGTHERGYSLGFTGRIPEGYGAGTVRQEMSEPVEILQADDRHVRFNVYSGRVPQQFFMKRMGENRWLLRNLTPTRDTKRWGDLIPSDKPHVKELPISEIRPDEPDRVMQPKIDGAQGIVVLEGGKPVRVFSYRDARNETGLIEHTHKFPGWWKPVPEGVKKTVLRAEILAEDRKGKVIPAHEIGGLLNASVWKSRAKQDEKGVRLGLRAWGAERLRGRNVSNISYLDQLQALREIAGEVPLLEVMPTAVTAPEKEKMLSRILSGKDPLTREGVILRDLRTGEIIKGKQRSDHDVFVREIVRGTRPGEAGAFRYSLTPRGPIVGRVGVGFDRSLRRQMGRWPDQFIGRAAKVLSQGQFRSGALRAPVFDDWHLDKGKQPFVEGDEPT